MSEQRLPRLGVYVFVFVVMSASVVGYFVGLQSPMRTTVSASSDAGSRSLSQEDGVLRATSYSDIGAALRKHRTAATKSQAAFRVASYEPGEVARQITPAEKQLALDAREQNRAFNGAPPTIPHPIDQMSSTSCMACHGEGIRTKTLRAAKISHPYYSNCTQCHVEQEATFAPSVSLEANSFQGLAALTAGPRAFEGAPPQVPHSTWMRQDCLSCHGFASEAGIQTTHPWRRNCTQCHAPSARLDQLPLAKKPDLLAPPAILP